MGQRSADCVCIFPSMDTLLYSTPFSPIYSLVTLIPVPQWAPLRLHVPQSGFLIGVRCVAGHYVALVKSAGVWLLYEDDQVGPPFGSPFKSSYDAGNTQALQQPVHRVLLCAIHT